MSPTRTSRAFSVVELAIVVALLAILAAIALPAFELYVRRSKTAEAPTNLRRIFSSSVAYFQTDHSGRQGEGLPRQFPVSVELTPGDSFCGAGTRAGKWEPQEVHWDRQTWHALNFAVSDPHYFAYQYESSGVDAAATFTARAVGDLDCDGTFSTFERVGRVDADADVTGGDRLIILNELE